MSFANRREFLRASGAVALSAAVPADLFAQSAETPLPSGPAWDPGSVRHLLPTVSDSRILIKASFNAPLPSAPTLRVGESSVAGRMSDTRGEFWHFHVTDLRPARTYRLSIVGNQGRPLCEPWELATFPAPDERPGQFRVLFFSCAGGHEAMKFLPPAVRNRLFRRALSFQPQAAVANGDHVYWDLLSPLTSKRYGASAEAEKIAGKFDRAGIVLGGDNETILKRAVDPQIAPIYGADFRSTPMFFVQDDHDYFDNDEATDDIITFPPTHFMLQLARATQVMYYPEFLPDVARPRGLPWSSAADRPDGVSETFGTIRYGRLAEILLYDIRRTMTLAGPSAVYVDPQAEKWADGQNDRDRCRPCRACALQSTRLERGQVGRMVPRHPRPRPQTDDEPPEALLATGLAQAARSADGRHVGDERTHPARCQWRYAFDCARHNARQRRAR